MACYSETPTKCEQNNQETKILSILVDCFSRPNDISSMDGATLEKVIWFQINLPIS